MDNLKRVSKMENILSALGIEMAVEGCGCFNSPHIKFNYKGEKIVDQGSCNFNNFGKNAQKIKSDIKVSEEEYFELLEYKRKYEEMIKYLT